MIHLQEEFVALEGEHAKLVMGNVELTGKCEKLSKQLAEARQREKQRLETQGKETEHLRAQLENLQKETQALKEREEKVQPILISAN